MKAELAQTTFPFEALAVPSVGSFWLNVWWPSLRKYRNIFRTGLGFHSRSITTISNWAGPLFYRCTWTFQELISDSFSKLTCLPITWECCSYKLHTLLVDAGLFQHLTSMLYIVKPSEKARNLSRGLWVNQKLVVSLNCSDHHPQVWPRDIKIFSACHRRWCRRRRGCWRCWSCWLLRWAPLRHRLRVSKKRHSWWWGEGINIMTFSDPFWNLRGVIRLRAAISSSLYNKPLLYVRYAHAR